MTASEAAKKAGLKSLAEVASITGQSTQTLNNWFNDKPELFKVVLAGCVNDTDLADKVLQLDRYISRFSTREFKVSDALGVTGTGMLTKCVNTAYMLRHCKLTAVPEGGDQ